MALLVESLSLQLIEQVQPLVARIKRQDRSLADQLVRAGSSVSLNIAEASYSDPGNRRARLFTAAGSANEVRAALRVAVAWRYCAAAQVEVALKLVDRVVAILWKMSRG